MGFKDIPAQWNGAGLSISFTKLYKSPPNPDVQTAATTFLRLFPQQNPLVIWSLAGAFGLYTDKSEELQNMITYKSAISSPGVLDFVSPN